MDNNSTKIAVLGAGVVGMTAAKLMQDSLRNAEITIIADKFAEDTTSMVAAGIFRPGTSFRGRTKEITQKWMRDSWDYWQDILRSSEASNAGVMQVDGYIFSKDNYHVTRNHLMEDVVPLYRPVEENELKLCGKGFKYGSYFSTIKAGCDCYLPWVERKFTAQGGKLSKSKIESFASLTRKYDLVLNCTGLGAKYLCDDHDLVPIRGQIIKARAPWLKTAIYGDYDTYIIPGMDGVATLGGTRQYDSYNLNVCRHDANAILERCCEIVPSLKKADIVGHKVGLRPHRVPVCVEGELINSLKVVHCYGHGGYGVMCAPGTALQAVQLGIDLLKSNTKNKI